MFIFVIIGTEKILSGIFKTSSLFFSAAFSWDRRYCKGVSSAGLQSPQLSPFTQAPTAHYSASPTWAQPEQTKHFLLSKYPLMVVRQCHK